mmetsp:Transcript_24738/g.58694  ORF Transcript_24738/g.58694 Transcript_24738/m.58694 type:complete len:99 (+) Transcript_24738:238-534(+)
MQCLHFSWICWFYQLSRKREIVIEKGGIVKHVGGLYIPCIPIFIPIFRPLVERGSPPKDETHVSDIACIPTLQWLVEGFCMIKHAAHVCDIACIPTLQ